MPKKEKPLIHFTREKCPFPVKIQTNSILQTVEGFIVADVGSSIWWIPKPARGCSQARHVMSKSIIEKIVFLKKDPFTLVNDVAVKLAQGQFGDQWDQDYFKDKKSKNKSQEEKQMIEGYCVKCKKKVEMQDIEITKTSKGVEMRKGKCPNCQTTVCRIGRIK